MSLNTTLGSYHRPTFESRAQYVAAREMKWGRDDVGYVTIQADLDTPLDLDALSPPCDDALAAKLYRTGFLAMVLTEDGKPQLGEIRERARVAKPTAVEEPPAPQSTGLQIKSHGFGRFSVIDQDGKRAAPTDLWLSKAEAEEIVANQG